VCGIAGILNLERGAPPTLEQLSAMLGPLRHRGPDETGAYLDERIAIGNLRLSIIGIANGIQPLCNETRNLWIAYNGEAFNYLELKEELLRKGHRFTTDTDTEVLLHLYEEHGTGCLERINGQFALAIWDSANQELFLARDRVGIRPLYYTLAEGRLVFASEIKAVLAAVGRREIDIEALSQVFVFWTTLAGRTVFKGVSELPPGHFMLVKAGLTQPERYWSIPFYPPEDTGRNSLAAAAEELRELLTDAVRIRLRADVPVGAYLSGGLDSSITSMLIARHYDTHLKTFSMGFREERFDETTYQEEMIRYLGVDHRRVMIDNQQIRGFFPETVWHCEKPLLRTAPVPLFMLSDLVRREGYKVVLCGEGADEIFGGYNIFKEAKIRCFWGRQPDSTLRPLLLEKLYPFIFKNPSRGRMFLQHFFSFKPEDLGDPFFSHLVRWQNGRKNLTFFSDHAIAALSCYDPLVELEARLPQSFFSRDPVSRAQVLEMEIFLANYLLSSQGDRVAMAHSVELRHPFLDFRVIDFSFGIPVKWKLRGLNEKYLLKKAFSGLVPRSITDRAKQPYRAPIRELFSAGERSDYVDDLLSEEYLKRSGYFSPDKVGRLLARYRRPDDGYPSEQQDMAFVGVLSTQILHRQFVEGIPPRSAATIRPDKVVYGGRA